jgi:hypothetical protein
MNPHQSVFFAYSLCRDSIFLNHNTLILRVELTIHGGYGLYKVELFLQFTKRARVSEIESILFLLNQKFRVYVSKIDLPLALNLY